MKKKYILTLALGLATASITEAQFNATNNLFYNTFRTPQSNQLNPAFFPERNTVYIELPSMSMLFSSPLGIGDLAQVEKQNGQDVTVININRILDALNENNTLQFAPDFNIFGFGFKIHNTFVNAALRVHTDFSFGIPTDIMNVLNRGNLDDNGNPIPLTFASEDLLTAQSYGELSVGLGHKFAPLGLTVGVHAKLLYGIMNVNLENTNITLNTYNDIDGNLDRLKVDAYYQAQISSVMPLDTTGGGVPKVAMPNVGDLLNVFGGNTGYSFDIGAKYDLGPFSFSFSVVDLSTGIHWRNNIATLTPANGSDTMSFSGVDLNQLMSNGNFNTDSLSNIFSDFVGGLKPSIAYGQDYYYGIPTKFNLGANFTFSKMLRAAVLFHSQLDKGLLTKKNVTVANAVSELAEQHNKFRWNATLSVGVNVFNWVELIVASSVVKDGDKISPLNPGVGLVLSLGGAFQTYVMADYVSSMQLVEAKAFNMKFGVNLLFGRGGKAKILGI